jgi:glucan phosphoethanolaminetransferase (alkaline phosphatase superfamily)
VTALAACLMVVFAAAKVILLQGRALPPSVWAPFVYVWQDVAVVLGFLLFERVVARAWAARVAYDALMLLAAINVPVERVLSSPLTAPMLKAARATLADSIRYHVTPANLAGIGVVLALGIALPLVPARSCPAWLRAGRAWVGAAVAVVILGATGASRVDTAGHERNPLVALVRSSLPRVRAAAGDADWRASPFGPAAGAAGAGGAGDAAAEDLSRLRSAAAGRNVLLVVLESTAARYLSTYGAAEDPMPALTALASRSIVFENAYAVYPESIKGFVAILASRYPGFDVPVERHVAVVAPSLATALAAAGFETAIFHSGRFMYLGMEEVVSRSGFALMEDAGAIGGNRNSSFGIDEGATVQRILRWMDALPRGRRFFAAYLPVAGHHPYAYAGHGPFPDSEEIGRYRNALHEGDHALGALLDGLRARGLDRSTVVVVLADHGEAFGQHAGNYGHTLALYDENVRVPLLIAMPGIDGAEGAGGAEGVARRVRRTASLLDVAPTVLDLLGLRTPPEFQGETLLADRARMALFFTDYSLGLLGLRDGCMKYIHELESGRSRMFDLCADPDERSDLIAGLAERAARYRRLLRAWSGAQVARITR